MCWVYRPLWRGFARAVCSKIAHSGRWAHPAVASQCDRCFNSTAHDRHSAVSLLLSSTPAGRDLRAAVHVPLVLSRHSHAGTPAVATLVRATTDAADNHTPHHT